VNRPSREPTLSDPFEQLRAALADRYTLERQVGHGGMATVYLAQDRKHHRRVAIKVLKPELAAALGPERFLREIEIAAGLNHPHILPLYDSGEAGASLYYVMPYVEGETLRDRLNRERQLPLEDALRITREVADALSYAHDHKVVHRDIKPENILFQAAHAVVSDFGIARAITAAAGGSLTATGIAIGTPAYMSPEQATGSSRLDGRSDIYGLGCVLYEMLAGEPPYTGPTAQVVIAKRLADPVPSVRRLRETVSPAIDAAVSKALAKAPADRFATAAQLGEALTRAGAPVARRRLSARRLLVAGAVTAVIGALVLTVARWRAGAGPALDPNLVAVVPFEVLDPKLELWREGLVDVLSANLDGAGPLRTVPPTVVIHRWRGRGDRASATQFGRATGARRVVFGTLVGSGVDSVRLSATVLDVASGAVTQHEVRESANRLDRLADSLTVDLLREFGGSRPMTAVRVGSLGTISLPALKAFLRGEQFLRRTVWDSARIYYRRAVELDSGFANAWKQLGLATDWMGEVSPALSYYLQAAKRSSRSLNPHDSMLIAGMLLLEQSDADIRDSAYHEHRARLLAAMQAAVDAYPDDPEMWDYVGVVHELWHVPGRDDLAQARAAFSRAIALDPAYGPAYLHALDLAARTGQRAEAVRTIDAYLALGPTAESAEAARLVRRVLVTTEDGTAGIRIAIDSAPDAVLFTALPFLWDWPDANEADVLIARRLATTRDERPYITSSFGDSLLRRRWAALILAHHGHWREAYVTGGPPIHYFVGLLLGGAPADSSGAWFSSSAPSFQNYFQVDRFLNFALPWWATQKDTAALRWTARRGEVTAGRATRNTEGRLWGRYQAGAARAFLALARGDSADALHELVALPDTVCDCLMHRVVAAQLLEAEGRFAAADSQLARAHPAMLDLADGYWHLERGRVAERVERVAEAVEEYRYVAALWRHADPQLQPYVREARAALARLGAEPRR